MIAFWCLAAVVIASAVWTISARKPVYSVVALLANFAALAALYMTLSAEFLAVMQIIVYSGAILILFVFVIALLSSGVAPFSMGPNRLPRVWIPATIILLGALGFLTYAASTQRGTLVSANGTSNARTCRNRKRLWQRRRLRQSFIHRTSVAVRSHRLDSDGRRHRGRDVGRRSRPVRPNAPSRRTSRTLEPRGDSAGRRLTCRCLLPIT